MVIIPLLPLLKNIWQMAAKSNVRVFLLVVFLSLIALSGCAARQSELVRIALLAPFEGRYREIGYDAYYAARLALADSGDLQIELLALDDGGSGGSAVERAKALAQDPLVKVVITLGYSLVEAEVQAALGDLPVIVVGEWGVRPQAPQVYVLSNPQIPERINLSENLSITQAAQQAAPLVGSDMLAMKAFPLLRSNISIVRIISSGSLPDAAFRERYLKTGLFVPEPGLLSTLTYDAFVMALRAVRTGDVSLALKTMTYRGLNGEIHFEQGYWANAPLYTYCYAQSTPAHLEACSNP